MARQALLDPGPAAPGRGAGLLGHVPGGCGTSAPTTTALQQRFPSGEPVAVEALLASVRAEPEGGRLTVGDERVVDFLVAFARKLLAPAVARRYPELASLGFFLRRGEISKALASV